MHDIPTLIPGEICADFPVLVPNKSEYLWMHPAYIALPIGPGHSCLPWLSGSLCSKHFSKASNQICQIHTVCSYPTSSTKAPPKSCGERVVPFHCLCMNMLENAAIDPVNWNRANSKESMTSFSLHDSFMKMLTKICQNTCLPAIHGSLGHGLAPALPLPGRNKLLVAQWIDMWIVSSRWVIGCGDMPRQITCRDKLMCVVYLVYNKMYMYDLWHWYDICCTLVKVFLLNGVGFATHRSATSSSQNNPPPRQWYMKLWKWNASHSNKSKLHVCLKVRHSLCENIYKRTRKLKSVLFFWEGQTSRSCTFCSSASMCRINAMLNL